MGFPSSKSRPAGIAPVDPPTSISSRAPVRAEDIVVGIGGAMLLGACLISPAASTTGPVVCPFRAMTGLPCPGCGMTRAWVAAAHGDVVASFLYNPYGLAFFAIAIVLVGWRLASMVRSINLPPVSLRWLVSVPGWVFLASWIVFGLARIGYVASNSGAG